MTILERPRIIIGLDPGNEQTGIVVTEDSKIVESGVWRNEDVLKWLTTRIVRTEICIEWIQAMGMAVGKEVFETCLWVGRFAQAASPCKVRLIPRGLIKHHHCGSSKAKDGNIIQALKDKYGDKGTKKAPGYFYGVSSHAWQAFAVAAYVMEGATDPRELNL